MPGQRHDRQRDRWLDADAGERELLRDGRDVGAGGATTTLDTLNAIPAGGKHRPNPNDVPQEITYQVSYTDGNGASHVTTARTVGRFLFGAGCLFSAQGVRPASHVPETRHRELGDLLDRARAAEQETLGTSHPSSCRVASCSLVSSLGVTVQPRPRPCR